MESPQGLHSHFYLRVRFRLLFVLILCGVSFDINGNDIRVVSCSLFRSSGSLLLDQKGLNAQADLVAVFVEINDLGSYFLAGLQNV